uniref:Uncharacterized protein n=1 Tax=Timema bartmani TaxID=61472 RepID=A0A7R9F5F3_9NEOP|nr:unnamed protein product [Timema bartmani]
MHPHLHGGRVERPLGKTTLSAPGRDQNPISPSLVVQSNTRLARYTTRRGRQSGYGDDDTNVPNHYARDHLCGRSSVYVCVVGSSNANYLVLWQSMTLLSFCLYPEPETTFVADHPFIFVLLDRPTKAILFYGKSFCACRVKKMVFSLQQRITIVEGYVRSGSIKETQEDF